MYKRRKANVSTLGALAKQTGKSFSQLVTEIWRNPAYAGVRRYLPLSGLSPNTPISPKIAEAFLKGIIPGQANPSYDLAKQKVWKQYASRRARLAGRILV
jgi:hypothetical protein